MSTQTDNPSISIDAGEALEAYRCARPNGMYADAGHRDAVGVTQEKVASGEPVALRLKSAGTLKVCAAGVIAQYAEVFAADDGKVQALPATPGVYIKRGVALNAATGDGSIIEIAPEGWGIAVVAVNQAASAAVTNTTDANKFDKQFTIPANFLKAGDIIRIRAQGIATATNSTDTLTLKLFLGTVEIVTTGAVDVANGDIGYIECDIVIRTIGATGTLVASGVQALGVPGTVTAKPFLKASTSVDTTAANAVAVEATWSVASASNSCRLDVLAVGLPSAA